MLSLFGQRWSGDQFSKMFGMKRVNVMSGLTLKLIILDGKGFQPVLHLILKKCWVTCLVSEGKKVTRLLRQLLPKACEDVLTSLFTCTRLPDAWTTLWMLRRTLFFSVSSLARLSNSLEAYHDPIDLFFLSVCVKSFFSE